MNIDNSFFTNFPSGIIYQNAKGNIITANIAAEKILGLSLNQLQGKSITNPNWKLIKEDGSDFPYHEQPAILSLKTGKPSNNVVIGILKPKTENYIWLNLDTVPEFNDGEDEPNSVYTIITDITESQNLKGKLRESEKRYREFTNLLPEIVFEVDADLNLLYVNKTLKEKIGVSLNDFSINKLSVISLLDESDKPRLLKNFKEKLNGKSLTANVYKFIYEGIPRYLQIFNSPVYKKGKITGLRGIAVDITDRQYIEEKLKESEEKLHSIVQGSENAIFTINDNEEITFINKAGTELLGYPEDELINHNFLKFLDTDSLDLVTERYKKRQAGEKVPSQYRFTIVRKDRTKRRVEINSSVIINRAGKPETVANLIDITEAEQKQNEVIDAQLRLNAFFNANTDKMFIKDSERRYMELNDEMCKFFDKSKDEIIGQKDEELTLNNRIRPCTSSDKQVLDKKSIISLEEHLGNRIFSVTKFPIILNNDLLIGGILRDVTQAKKMKKELEESRNTLQVILDNMPGGYMMIDENYIIQQVNKQACRITGYSQEELLGSLCDTVCPKGSASKNCPIWKHRQTAFTGMDTNIKCKDGSKIPIIKNAKTITIKGKRFLIESFQDISNLKQTEQDLVRAKEKAEESDRLKSSFLANMSHEIRTPMNGILGFTSLLGESDFSDADKKFFIETIQKSGERMLNTVNDIVEISKIEVGEVTIRKKEININEKIAEIVNFFIPEAKNKELNLKYVLPLDEESAIINTDESKFESIVTNLVKNAIKYSISGSIEFGYQASDDKIQFYCRDEGIGIPANRIEAIFNRFEQVDIEATRSFEGSGLGLAITKAYVEMLDGKIWVESVEGEGSVFYFSLPFQMPT